MTQAEEAMRLVEEARYDLALEFEGVKVHGDHPGILLFSDGSGLICTEDGDWHLADTRIYFSDEND